MATSKLVKTILEGSGIITYPITRYVMPTEEDIGAKCLMISDVGGPGNDGDVGYDNIQFIVRSDDTDEATDTLDLIKVYLEEYGPDTNFAGFVTKSSIIYLGRDFNSRDSFSLNMVAIKQTI